MARRTLAITGILLLGMLCSILLPLGCRNSRKEGQPTIHFRVIPTTLRHDSRLYLAGNTVDMGGWNRPDGLQLDPQPDGSWVKSLSYPAGTIIQYFITRGTWQTMAVDSAGFSPRNNNFRLDRDTTITFVVMNWRDKAGAADRIFADSTGRPVETVLNSYWWRYHPGDDTTWSGLNVDDDEWEPFGPDIFFSRWPKSGWDGIGWFRLHIVVDTALWNKPLAFSMRQTGASEIFIDGELKYTIGKVGATAAQERRLEDTNPQTLLLSPKPGHVIAVRFSNASIRKLWPTDMNVGFEITIGDLNREISRRTQSLISNTTWRMVTIAIPSALAILHLLLFFFYPNQRVNLYSAFWMAGLATLLFFRNPINSEIALIWQQSIGVIAIPTIFFGLLSAYSLRYQKIPRRFGIYLLIGIPIAIWQMLQPMLQSTNLVFLVCGISMLDIMYCFFPGKARKLRQSDERTGSLIIGTGAWILGLLLIYDLLVASNLVVPFKGYEGSVYLYGVLALSVAVSLSLSYRFAGINRNLQKQLIQVKDLSEKAIEQERRARDGEISRRLLEADNERKTRELDEARDLQLSMLPKTLPSLPQLEIAVYMKTATEVGGDYYDFSVAPDGTLTIAIGDATGHGAKAGTMVTIVKSMFHEFSDNPDIVDIFRKYTTGIKRLNLGSLYMALLIMKIRDHELIASSAGMPPPFIYRASSQDVDILDLKGMPLGNFLDFPYQQMSTTLAPGDTIVLMSDGFPEMFNEKREILDYSSVKGLIGKYGHLPPQEIIDRLSKEGETWANGRPQDDDVTFVVVKSR